MVRPVAPVEHLQGLQHAIGVEAGFGKRLVVDPLQALEMHNLEPGWQAVPQPAKHDIKPCIVAAVTDECSKIHRELAQRRKRQLAQGAQHRPRDLKVAPLKSPTDPWLCRESRKRPALQNHSGHPR
eukprot:scaffold117184_cov63-Phaeocystis_antarctica.AAC.2